MATNDYGSLFAEVLLYFVSFDCTGLRFPPVIHPSCSPSPNQPQAVPLLLPSQRLHCLAVMMMPVDSSPILACVVIDDETWR